LFLLALSKVAAVGVVARLVHTPVTVVVTVVLVVALVLAIQTGVEEVALEGMLVMAALAL
jgi:hypothetical protein